MRAETALPFALVVVTAAVLAGAALAAPADGGSDRPAAAGEPVDTPTGDEPTVRLDVQLLETGDANWTVTTYVPIEDEDDRETFRDLGRQYVNDSTDAGVDPDLFRRAVVAARDASGRPMRLAAVERDWAIRDGTGVLVLRFTWLNFARESGDSLVVDDAFETESGTWLPRLEPGQVLVIRPPEGLGFIEAPTGVTNATLRWEGPTEFGPDYFRIVYRTEPDETPTTPPPTTPPTTPPPTTVTATPTDTVPAGTYVVSALLVAALLVGYLWLRRGPGPSGDAAGEREPTGGDAPPASAVPDGSDGTVEAPGGTDEPEGPPEPTPEEPFAGVDVEMLSDEERVLRLLDANGGRMKQAQIVKETDWSNAKVSQLLSGMAEDGTIDKLRIGRENLISLPDVDVDSFEE